MTAPASATGPDGGALQFFSAEGRANPLAGQAGAADVREERKAGIMKAYGKFPLYFIENKGQVDDRVSYYEKGPGHATFFTRGGVVISLAGSGAGYKKTGRLADDIRDPKREGHSKVSAEAVTLSFVGARKDAAIIAEDQMPGRVNYFVGNDKSKWRSNSPPTGP